MRKLIIISTVLLFFFTGCTTVKKINGNYGDGEHIELVFTDAPNKFEYYSRGEMGILVYSTGNWVQNKNQVILNGFTDINIKSLSVENKITDNADNKDKVLIRYTPTSSLVKADVIINDNNIVRLSMDTIFFSAIKIKTVQVKSYLSYTGLLSSNPKIDTLYSSKIEVDNNSNKNKDVALKFAVDELDFARRKLTDTITVRNRAVLYLNKIKFRKFKSQ